MDISVLKARRWPLLLATAILVGLFYNLGAVPLFDLDEGIYSEATREMFVRGDFITPYYNGEPFYEKPILMYWLQAASVALFGLTEFAFRLPSALASSLLLWALFVFVRQQRDEQTAYVAAIMGATALGLSIIGRAATTDALLSLFLSLALFDAYRYYQGQRPRHRHLVFLWIGLGLLTKGPVAIVIPLLITGLFYVWRGQWRLWLTTVFHPIGWLILLAVAAPWYVAEYLREGQAFIDGFFLQQNMGRFNTALEGHGGSVLYYLYYIPVALLLTLPFTTLLFRILPGLRHAAAEPLALYLWIWFLVVFGMFSLAQTKLPHYLIYGLPPLIMLMAMARDQLRSGWLAFLPAFALFAVILTLPWLAIQVANGLEATPYVTAMLRELDNVFTSGYYLVSGGLLVVIVILAGMRRWLIWERLLAVGLVCAFAMGHLVVPAIGELQQGPVKEAAHLTRDLDELVVMDGLKLPSFNVYREQITPRRRPQPGEVAFVRIDRLAQLGEYELLYQRGGVALARLKDADPKITQP